MDGQSAANGLSAGAGGENWLMAVAIAQRLEPRNVGDASSGVRAVAYGDGSSELVRPPAGT